MWLVLLGVIAFWVALYLAYGRRGGEGKVQILPFGVIIRAGVSLEPMDPGSLKARLLRVVGLAGLAVMAYLAYMFFRIVGTLFAVRYLGVEVPGVSREEAGLVPLIPGVTIPLGDLVYVLVGVGIAALFHELAHAYIARAEGLRVKDAGIAFILFFPAAFVEPDEEELKRAPLKSRLAVYSAGVTANTLIYLALALLAGIVMPHLAYGVAITGVAPDSPASEAGLQPGMVIVEANGVRVKSIEELARVLEEAGVGNPNTSSVVTLKVEYRGQVETITVEKPVGEDRIGVTIVQAYRPQWLGVTIQSTMFFNLMLAIINAAPLAIPLPGGLLLSDGGHALRDTLARIAGRKGEIAAGVLNIMVFIVILSLMTLTQIRLTP
ncbi:MAG: site-2 protease family protein [Desulfurococcales archaeon]|nr:site-2 protease family protein [Desulfurococcales archaeon]